MRPNMLLGIFHKIPMHPVNFDVNNHSWPNLYIPLSNWYIGQQQITTTNLNHWLQ